MGRTCKKHGVRDIAMFGDCPKCLQEQGRVRQQTAWQPIETMPIGEYVLLTNGIEYICAKYMIEGATIKACVLGVRDATVYLWPAILGRSDKHYARWWMPLPAPPSGA